MAKDKPAPEAKPTTVYMALTRLSYWAAGKLKKVPAGQVVDDVPKAVTDNWLTITPPAIRTATADEIAASAKGVV